MALQKDLELSTGVVANYHRICDPKINAIDGSGTVLVKLYLNQAARLANKKECSSKLYKLPLGIFSTLNLANTDARSLAYSYIKSLPEYNGAIDVWNTKLH